MATDPPFPPMDPYLPSNEEVQRINDVFSSWMSPERMKSEIEEVKKTAGWSVQVAANFKIVREAIQAVVIAELLRAAELRMNLEDHHGGPDFWMRLQNEEIPFQLTSIYNPDRRETPIYIGSEDTVIEPEKDYSQEPEDKFIRGIPHAGQWRSKFGQAVRTGDEGPKMWLPNLENVRGLPEWARIAIEKKNKDTAKHNYVKGTVLVAIAEFPIMIDIPRYTIDGLIESMRLGSAFRTVIVYLPNPFLRTNEIFLAMHNSAFPKINSIGD